MMSPSPEQPPLIDLQMACAKAVSFMRGHDCVCVYRWLIWFLENIRIGFRFGLAFFLDRW